MEDEENEAELNLELFFRMYENFPGMNENSLHRYENFPRIIENSLHRYENFSGMNENSMHRYENLRGSLRTLWTGTRTLSRDWGHPKFIRIPI